MIILQYRLSLNKMHWGDHSKEKKALERLTFELLTIEKYIIGSAMGWFVLLIRLNFTIFNLESFR